MADIVEQVEAIAENVTYIRHMLEGDDFSTGLVKQVKANEADIKDMRKDQEKSGYSNSTLVAISWIFLVVALVITVADRAVLISDIRHLLPITAIQAGSMSVVLGVTAKVMIAVPVTVFISGIINHDK